jgi:hypothetical protein
VPAQHVDRSAIAELVEGHLNGDFPSGGPQLGDHAIDEHGVRLIEEAVEAFSSPPHANIEIGAKGMADELELRHVGVPGKPELDVGDERPRHARRGSEVCLAPSEANADRPHRPADTEAVHRNTLGPGAYRSLM